jgi:hypothetical protein
VHGDIQPSVHFQEIFEFITPFKKSFAQDAIMNCTLRNSICL